jgi:hypothetical protein
MVTIMRSIFTSKLALGLALVGLGLLENSSALAGEPIVAIPVTGGQFTVDLKIQNGVVQNYGYQNNQIPTLLSPVGTISLTSAAAPNIVSFQKYWVNDQSLIPEPTSNVPVAVFTSATGQAGLNDGRIAQFKDAAVRLQGLATASSPLFIASMGNLAGGLNSALVPPPLPQNYDGTIAVQIQAGNIAIPSSLFSNPSNAVNRFDISSAKISSKTNSSVFESKEDWVKIDRKRLYTSPLFDQTFSFEANQVGSISQITLLSPMGTTSLNIKNLTFSGYYRDPYSQIYNPPSETVTAVANGTVLLTDGKVVQVKDRLIWFEPQVLGYVTIPVPNDIMRTTLVGINLNQGRLYIDNPTNILEPIISTDIPPIATSNLSEFSISSQTRILTEPVAQTQLESSNLQPPSMTMNSTILASPLSSSRIFPEVGISR